jgi:hypothetical protein
LLVAALDGDFCPTSLLDIAIDEVRRDIEHFRQSDQELSRLLPVFVRGAA